MNIDEKILNYIASYPAGWGPTTRRLSTFVGVAPIALRSSLARLQRQGDIASMPSCNSTRNKRWVLK